jgi:predicted DNA binding CopG/RHH family protein
MKIKKPKTRAIPLRLSEDTINRTKVIARAELLPYSAILRRAIVEWLDAHEKRGKG